MTLNLVDRVLGEILVDLRNDGASGLLREGRPQIGKRARRRDQDQRIEMRVIESFGDLLGEYLLGEPVPIFSFSLATMTSKRLSPKGMPRSLKLAATGSAVRVGRNRRRRRARQISSRAPLE
jgi:hypothetical protein